MHFCFGRSKPIFSIRSVLIVAGETLQVQATRQQELTKSKASRSSRSPVNENFNDDLSAKISFSSSFI